MRDEAATMIAAWITVAGQMIELGAAIVVAFYAAWSFTCILRLQGSDRARIVIAEGVLAALGFMVAGTLLTALALQSWQQIRTFAVIFALRTLLKKVFSLEKGDIEAHGRASLRGAKWSDRGREAASG